MTTRRPMDPESARDAIERLEEALASRILQVELCQVGGAVMSLVFSASPATRSVSALFRPSRLLDEAVDQVGGELGLGREWLPGAVKAVLAEQGDGPAYVEMPHIRVLSPPAPYLLAMKCAALAVNRAPRDRDDIRFLLRFLNVSSAETALPIVHQYFNNRQLPMGLEELLEGLLSARAAS